MEPEIITLDSDDDDDEPIPTANADPQNRQLNNPHWPVPSTGDKVHLSYPGQIVATVLPVRAQISNIKGPKIVFKPSQFSPGSVPQVRTVQPTKFTPILPTHIADQKEKTYPIGRVELKPAGRKLRPVLPAPPKVHLTFASIANKGQHLGSAFMGRGNSTIALARPAEAAVRAGTGPGSYATGQMSGSPKPRVSAQRNNYPRRPSKFSSFLLFSKEQRERLLKENKDLNFCEVGRTLGKLWRELSVEEKNKYRVQARQLQEKKYKEWESDLMKLSGPAQLQYLTSMTKQHKRRRKSGYDVFMLEMRKNLAGGLSQPEIMKKIGEAWRSAPDETRNNYERRAEALNVETESYSKIEDKRREDGVMTRILQLIRDSKETRQSSLPELSNQSQQTTSQKNLVGNGGFASSEPPKLSWGGSFQRIPAPPPLVFGGKSMPKSVETNDNFRAMKRVYPHETISNAGGSPNKRSTPSFHEESDQRQIKAPLCRLCGQRSLKYTELANKPDIIQSVKTVLEIDIDIQKDELGGYPSTVCLKCLGLLTHLENFRSSVMAGQEKLKLLTVAISSTNGTSLTPSATKKVSDKIENSSAKTASRFINMTNVLSNVPRPLRTFVKEETVDEVEILEDELLRLEEQQKEDTVKTLLDQDNLAPFFDDTHISELKKIAGISDDDDDEDEIDDDDFEGGIVDDLDLISTARENLPSPNSLLDTTENYREITENHLQHESESLVEAEKVFQMDEKSDMTEIYKYFHQKRGNNLPKHSDIKNEDENEVEEIDCKDVRL